MQERSNEIGVLVFGMNYAVVEAKSQSPGSGIVPLLVVAWLGPVSRSWWNPDAFPIDPVAVLLVLCVKLGCRVNVSLLCLWFIVPRCYRRIEGL